MSSGKKTSTIEEDFESLFVEEEENTKDNNFNDLFEKISEESVEPVKESSVSEKEITENIEEDFDALLDDETLQCVKDEVTDSKNSKSTTKEVDSNHGFSQIFSSNSSDDATNDDKVTLKYLNHVWVLQCYRLIKFIRLDLMMIYFRF